MNRDVNPECGKICLIFEFAPRRGIDNLKHMSAIEWAKPVEGGVTLSIRVQPRASRNELGPVHAGQLKVKVTAPPVDSAANEAVVELIAENFGCSRGSVQLLRGQTSKSKVLFLRGITMAALEAWSRNNLENSKASS